jgi:uncharacterized membrane protein YhfC
VTPVVQSTWGIALSIMIAGPIALASWFWRRYGVSPRAFLYGALVFVVFQLILRLPLVTLVTQRIGTRLGEQSILLLYLLGLAFSAGLFESIGRWAGYRWLFPGRLPYDWAHGVAYGIGHGGIESAVLVGLSSALNFIQALVLTTLPLDQLQSQYSGDMLTQVLQARDIYAALAWYEPLLAAIERAATIPLHVALALLVMRVFTSGQQRWLLYAIVIHGLADITALFASQMLRWPAWAVEIVVVIWGAASLWYILHRRRQETSAIMPEGGNI